MQRPLEASIKDSLFIASKSLGPHTDVHVFTPSGYRVHYWTQIRMRPYGVDRLIMCPHCNNLCELTLDEKAQHEDGDKTQRGPKNGTKKGTKNGTKATKNEIKKAKNEASVNSVTFKCQAILRYEAREAKSYEQSRPDGMFPVRCPCVLRYDIPNYKRAPRSAFRRQADENGLWMSFSGEALVGNRGVQG